MVRRWWLLLAALPAPALAQDARDLCPERPGLGTPPCIVERGHLLAEVGVADWTLDMDSEQRTDDVTFAQTLLRYGIGQTTELQLGWNGLGYEREQARTSGAVRRRTRAGDVTVALKQNLINPDGDKFSFTLLPSVTLPLGRRPIGAGTWSAGLRAPVSYEVADGISLEATPEIDAAADEDGHGRHLAYGSVAGMAVDVTKAVTLSLEGELLRDRDPADHATLALASFSVAWQPSDDLQLDAGSVAGLNAASPDVEVYMGVSRRF